MKRIQQKELTREIQQRIDLDDLHEDRFNSTNEKDSLFPEGFLELRERMSRKGPQQYPD